MLMPATQFVCLTDFINSFPFHNKALHSPLSFPMGHPKHSSILNSFPPSSDLKNPSRHQLPLLDPNHHDLPPSALPHRPNKKIIPNLNSKSNSNSNSHLSRSSSRPIAQNGFPGSANHHLNGQSTDSQNTETPSSSSLQTPELHPSHKSPPKKRLQGLPPPPEPAQHRQPNGYHLARNPRRSSSKTPNSRKRKPGGLHSDSSDSDHSATAPRTKYPSSRPSNPITYLHPRHPTPKRLRTEAIADLEPSSKVPMPSYFTTQRFPTPKHTRLSNGDLSISTDGSRAPSDQSPYGFDQKGKARETRPSSRSRPPRSRSRPHTDSSSDQSDSQLDPRPGSSSNARTPKADANPHIYGRQDRKLDNIVSIPDAETPMLNKNRQFRRGVTKKQKDDRTELGHDLEPSTPYRSGSGSSGTSNGHHRYRRGSRASSIGSGHEALPHPRIPPGMLHRHIRPDLPPPMRCRTLLSWCSQKAEHACLLALQQPAYKSKRLIPSELPNPLRTALEELARPNASARPSSTVANAVKIALQSFIRGVCEGEVAVEMSAGGQGVGEEVESVEITGDQSFVDLESLPRHPQDLKNEQKIKELNHWRTRMSYEDHARQFQLTRYNRLMENLARRPTGQSVDGSRLPAITEDPSRVANATGSSQLAAAEGSSQVVAAEGPSHLTPTDGPSHLASADRPPQLATAEGPSRVATADGPSRLATAAGRGLETVRLCDKAAVLEYGRLLRAHGGEPARRVDVLEEHGRAWAELPVTMGLLAEEFGRLAAKVRTVEGKVRRLQAGSTQKLKGLEEQGAVSSIEAKLMAASVDGVGACLEALDIGTGAQSARPRSLEQRGKRDFLRSLSRCGES